MSPARCFCGRSRSLGEFICAECYALVPAEIQNQLVRGGRWVEAQRDAEAFLAKHHPVHLANGQAWKVFDSIQFAEGPIA